MYMYVYDVKKKDLGSKEYISIYNLSKMFNRHVYIEKLISLEILIFNFNNASELFSLFIIMSKQRII